MLNHSTHCLKRHNRDLESSKNNQRARSTPKSFYPGQSDPRWSHGGDIKLSFLDKVEGGEEAINSASQAVINHAAGPETLWMKLRIGSVKQPTFLLSIVKKQQ